ncbi:MAG: c-type cytochrome [Archangium sp.]
MRTRLLLFAVLSSVPAMAADAAVGEALFQERCASCHTATPTATESSARKKTPPDLALRMKQRTGDELRAWVLDPRSRKKESACNTTVFARNPELAPELWAFLQGQLQAPPAPVLERRREAMKRYPFRSNEFVTKGAK